MNKPLFEFFTNDHRRIEGWLDKATKHSEKVDEKSYHQFRTGLLKHIKMEEKILFPAAQRANGDVPIPLAAQLRTEHGAITALMVLPPTESVIKVLRFILEKHDWLEERPGGMYDICERLTQQDTTDVLQLLNQATEVPVHPYNAADYALDSAKRALIRAGFDFDEIVMTT
ncbi:MAG: hemerythrin domain-containing protein [Bacteroidetes bacterium]|nr:hemerythrin domain-containing protein [Bacteroidota bacterium]